MSYDIEGWTNEAGAGVDVTPNVEWGVEGYEALNYEPGANQPVGGGGGFVTFDGVPSKQASAGWTPATYSGTTSPDTVGMSRSVSGGGGGGVSRAIQLQNLVTGRRSTTQYLGGGAIPTMAGATYNAPEYSYDRINYLTQQQLAPQATKLRNALYTGIGKVAATDNPYMQAQARKQLMQGYGGGLSEATATSARTAQQLYNTEYQGKVAEAQANWQNSMAVNKANFEAALAEWQKSLTAQTTEETAYNGNPFSSAYGTTPAASSIYGTDYDTDYNRIFGNTKMNFYNEGITGMR